jgi:hypothetical protein
MLCFVWAPGHCRPTKALSCSLLFPSLVLCRYLDTNVNEYWKGDVEQALQPHPIVILGSGNLNTPHLTA